MLLIVCSTLLFASCLTSALTIPSLRTLNLARAFGGTTSPQPDHACTKDAQWLGDGYSQENCMATVQRLWNADVSTNDHTQFEFLAPGAQNKTSLPAMQTPRRYVSGKCTLAIVMLNTFPSGILPGEDPQGTYTYGTSDVTSFYDLWSIGGTIELNCLMGRQSPGWGPAGDHYNIGVFIWNSDSYWNRNIPYSPPTSVPASQDTGALDAVTGASQDQSQLVTTS